MMAQWVNIVAEVVRHPRADGCLSHFSLFAEVFASAKYISVLQLRRILGWLFAG